MSYHEMMDEQLRIEEEMRSVTRQRYFKLHENADDRGDLADTHAGRNVLDTFLAQFTLAVHEWAEDKKAGGAGRRPRAVKMIDEFNDTPTLAFIFLKHLINTTTFLTAHGDKKTGAAKTTRIALQCTQAIHDELRLRYFADNRKALLRTIIKDFQRRELDRRRRRDLLIKEFNKQQLEWQAAGWGQKERLNLGIVLMDLLRTSTGMIELRMVTDGPRSVSHVYFTDEAVEAIADRMDKAADLFTVFYPLVVPPKPWAPDVLVGGAYYSDNVRPYPFVKGAGNKFTSELEARDMSAVVAPINALQNTAWRVNERMLTALSYVYDNNIKVEGLPSADPIEAPPPPPGITQDPECEILAEYKKDCYMVHEENRRMKSKRISVLKTVALAHKFARYDAIYFPYDVDSRGRAYPKVPFLNPQGPDYVKGLLEFSEGKPIGTEEHAAYLAIAVANAWGQDKLPLQERVYWVQDNEELILSVGSNPLTDLRWLQADEPFMALRGAIEWFGLEQEGPGFISHMPVHFDATCSGLQHFSALLRDAEGGRYVNLTDNDERQDIYAEVARKATVSLRSDPSPYVSVALEMGISRSLAKRPVMIVPYSGTFSACMDYILQHYKERMASGEVLPVDIKTLRTKVVPLVAKHVWAAINDTVIAAREAMNWITASARGISKNVDAPIQWTTPDGFVVRQARYKERSMSVETYLDGGRRVQSYLASTEDKTGKSLGLDPKAMSQSLSPNYIHSLDAAHLRATVVKAEEIGGMSYAMIHDSFGVHAADMATFVEECIKPAFVEMFQKEDLLAKFRREIYAGTNYRPDLDADGNDPYELPQPGTLDIEEVKKNQFFFS